jgi:hypothetical protein
VHLVDVAIEQHVGAPVRLVAAADIQHESGRVDRDADAPSSERLQAVDDVHAAHRWNKRTRPFW